MFGGLIVGMVVKYADNILKNFANALSVIFTVIGAIPLFSQYPSGWFIVGVAAVMLSVFMYGKSTPQVSFLPFSGYSMPINPAGSAQCQIRYARCSSMHIPDLILPSSRCNLDHLEYMRHRCTCSPSGCHGSPDSKFFRDVKSD